MSVLGEVFRRYAKNPDVQRLRSTELEQHLLPILDACRIAWPELDVSADSFVRHLAENLPGDGRVDDCLSRMHCEDVYLACGCAAGDRAALAAFEHVLHQAVPVLHGMGLGTAQVDEVIQIMRAKLLVADESAQPPAIASFAGHGALVGWVRITARRTALSLRRNMDERIGGNEPELGDMPFPEDVELDYLKSRYRSEFKQAVEDALAALEPEQLRVLRFHYVDGLSIDRIGALLGMHRATAARRIRAACDAVRDQTRQLLHQRLRLSASELDSLAGLVQSQLHLSLGRLLQTR